MKNKTILVLILVITVLALIYYFVFYQKESQREEGTELANPAAVYCQEQGGTAENVIFEAGERTYCLFADGSKCWQWDFFRGDCQPGDLTIEVQEEGSGPLIDNGQTAVAHYTGWLEDGTKFDSSLDRGQPFSFVLGEGRVILGWEQGVLGMKVGEKRKLILGSDLAYGETGISGAIPAKATLVFEVELLAIQ